MPDRVKPSFVIFDIRHSDAQPWASECPDVKNYKWHWLNPVSHCRMLHSCTHMATVGVKWLMTRLHVTMLRICQCFARETSAPTGTRCCLVHSTWTSRRPETPRSVTSCQSCHALMSRPYWKLCLVFELQGLRIQKPHVIGSTMSPKCRRPFPNFSLQFGRCFLRHNSRTETYVFLL